MISETLASPGNNAASPERFCPMYHLHMYGEEWNNRSQEVKNYAGDGTGC